MKSSRRWEPRVITASTDSVYSHKAWQEAGLGKLKFPHLADTAHHISRAYGVLIEDKGIALARHLRHRPRREFEARHRERYGRRP
jgi:alkyl hydroperoxide reductase subunit AhpC